MLIFLSRWSLFFQLPLAPSFVQLAFLSVVGSAHGDSYLRSFCSFSVVRNSTLVGKSGQGMS